MDAGILASDTVLFARIVHGFKRDRQVLQVFVQLGAMGEQHIVIRHAMIDQQRAFQVFRVREN